METTLSNSNNVVAYFWTNLALIEQGVGIDQQRKDLEDWLTQQPGSHMLAEFTDKHLKRTKPKHFPQLAKAVQHCLSSNAKLVVVKLDGLISQKEFSDLLATTGLDFVCLDKDLVTPEVLSVVRQYVEEQSKQHGNSIKRGLRLTSSRLGNPNAAKAISPFNKIKTENSVLFALLLQPVIAKYQAQGLSQRKIVSELNDAGIVAPEGGQWVLSQLQKVLKRIATNNLAIDLANEIEKNNYQEYSAAELISTLNQGQVKPFTQNTWDEGMLSSVKNRNKTIVNVLELYNFMQQWGDEVNGFISQGKTLDDIATELNNRQLAVPQALLEE